MAMYVCSRCDKYVDDDWNPCTEDPKDELGLMCPSCVEEIGEENYDDLSVGEE